MLLSPTKFNAGREWVRCCKNNFETQLYPIVPPLNYGPLSLHGLKKKSDPKPPATDGWHSAIRYLFFEINANMQILLVSLETG